MTLKLHLYIYRFKSVDQLEDASTLPAIRGMTSSGMIWPGCLGSKGN